MHNPFDDTSPQPFPTEKFWNAISAISKIWVDQNNFESCIEESLRIIAETIDANTVSLVVQHTETGFSQRLYSSLSPNGLKLSDFLNFTANFPEHFFTQGQTHKSFTAILEQVPFGNEKVDILQYFIPVCYHNKNIAVLGIHMPEVHEVKASQQNFLELVANFLAPNLSNKNTFHELDMANQRLKLTQWMAKLGHWEYNPKTSLFKISYQVKQILGIKTNKDVFTRKELFAKIDNDDTQRIYIALDDAVQNNKNFEVEFVIKNQGAQTRYIKASAGNFLDTQYPQWNIQGILQDITAQKILEEHMQEATRKAEEADRVKSIFLANISHEIKTPLNAIIGFTKLLQSSNLSKIQSDEYFEFIESNTRNLLYLINDIIDIAKIETGQLILKPRFIKISKFIADLHISIQNQNKIYGNQELEIRTDIDDFHPEYKIFTDQLRLKQVILILISNALKFTPKGYVEYGIKKAGDAEILIYVKDTGIGIPENKIDLLFNQFGKMQDGVYINPVGTGIGLSLAKFLIEALGGTIRVESTENIGTTFFIQLKYNTDDVAELPAEAEKNSEPMSAVLPTRLLVVEDNPINQRLLIDSLQVFDKNIEFLIANNGLEGVEILKQNLVDIVIMDIRMPVMDGMEATRYIRNNMEPPARNVPIIALTAHAMRDEAKDCLEIGMNSYFTKPFIPSELYAEIKRILQSDPKQIISIDSQKTEVLQKEKPVLSTDDFDFSMLLSLYNHNYIKMIDILNLYLEQIPLQLNSLNEAGSKQDWKKVRTIAHSIKSTMNYLGMKQISELALEIEKNIEVSDYAISFPEKANLIANLWSKASVLLNNLIADWTKNK